MPLLPYATALLLSYKFMINLESQPQGCGGKFLQWVRETSQDLISSLQELTSFQKFAFKSTYKWCQAQRTVAGLAWPGLAWLCEVGPCLGVGAYSPASSMLRSEHYQGQLCLSMAGLLVAAQHWAQSWEDGGS